jgi:hypothetical protein
VLEVVTLGQDREPGVPVMRNIPLDLQRSCELRWAARFLRPLASAAPQKQGHAERDQADPGKVKKKTRPAEAAGLRSVGAVCERGT